MKTTTAVLMTLLLSPIVANAAEPSAQPQKSLTEKCQAALNAPKDFKARIQAMENGLLNHQDDVEKAEREIRETKARLNRLEEQMNWRELNLWRWLARILGGDAKKIDEHTIVDGKAKYADILRNTHQETHRKADQAIVDKITEYLKASDAEFAKLHDLETRFNKVVCQGDECLKEIASAIESTEAAKSTEMIDLVSSNKGISAFSSMSNSTAKTDARAAVRKTEEFFETAKALKETLKDPGLSLREHDDTLDLILDLAFDPGVDFLSFMSLSALGDMKTDLEKIKAQVEEAHKLFSEEQSKLKSEISAILCESRKICRN